MVEFIQVKGNHKEMGLQQGEQMKEKIKAMIDYILHSEMFSEVKPRLVPIWLVKIALGLMGRFKSKKTIQKYVPKQHEKMMGIAKGADLSKNFTYGMHYIEIYTGDPRSTNYIPQGCTMLFALPPATADNSIIFARNYDFPKQLQPYQMVRIDEPEDGNRTICMTQYCLAGTHMGMNEKGLAIGINYARTWEKYPDDFRFNGVPPTLIIQEVLENFETTDEAIEFITNFPARANAQFYGIIDKSGDACVIETTCKRFAVRRPEEGIMAHSNTFRVFEDMNVPDRFHWKLKSMKHVPYIKSPKMRYNRAFELLNKFKGNITIETCKEILSDHYNADLGKPGSGDDFTICNHGETGITLASMIIRPQTGQFYVTDVQPCQSMYEQFKI
ncbi:MAG: C45 family autoproteolytic acyltransferase/hydrolase [Candidatus Helarchaeota archaeon]